MGLLVCDAQAWWAGAARVIGSDGDYRGDFSVGRRHQTVQKVQDRICCRTGRATTVLSESLLVGGRDAHGKRVVTRQRLMEG